MIATISTDADFSFGPRMTLGTIHQLAFSHLIRDAFRDSDDFARPWNGYRKGPCDSNDPLVGGQPNRLAEQPPIRSTGNCMERTRSRRPQK